MTTSNMYLTATSDSEPPWNEYWLQTSLIFAYHSSEYKYGRDCVAMLCPLFRRSGKPTSLGCFDHEEQAARAYDKMMLWCELHNSSGVKGGITNFDPAEYEKDLSWLQVVNQVAFTQNAQTAPVHTTTCLIEFCLLHISEQAVSGKC